MTNYLNPITAWLVTANVGDVGPDGVRLVSVSDHGPFDAVTLALGESEWTTDYPKSVRQGGE